MERVLSSALSQLVAKGALTVTFASGRACTYGDNSGEPVAIRFTDPGAQRRLVLDPTLQVGELFMDGRLLVEQGTVYDFISLLKRNGSSQRRPPHIAVLTRLRSLRAGIATRVRPDGARRNVAHHYDLDAGLFELFLDEDLQYSCAYFESPHDSLEKAQLAKKRHVSAKLLLSPGTRVLDIGSGWGGLALYLAKMAGVRVTGITLSENQLTIARQRARSSGLAEQVSFRLQDYRHVEDTFDRIVSVGMFEHVGKRNYATFFRKAAALLEPGRGVMVLHSIGRIKPAILNQPFIDKYVFPGVYVPALSEVLPAVEEAGFLITDIEILPTHYAWTLRAWRERFVLNRDKAVEIYDERFFRLWEFYLAGCEAAFYYDGLFVFQMQLALNPAAVPCSRDYIAQAELNLQRRDGVVRGQALPRLC